MRNKKDNRRHQHTPKQTCPHREMWDMCAKCNQTPDLPPRSGSATPEVGLVTLRAGKRALCVVAVPKPHAAIRNNGHDVSTRIMSGRGAKSWHRGVALAPDYQGPMKAYRAYEERRRMEEDDGLPPLVTDILASMGLL